MVDLSIIIPAFNESAKIARDVVAAFAFLRGEGMSGEVIVVDDGSSDGTADTAGLADASPGVELTVMVHDARRGKGAAVRTGVAASTGEFVMFADSGLCVPFEDALRGLELIRSGECDVAHGSRGLPGQVATGGRPLRRRLMSWALRFLTRMLLDLPRDLTDTQCGFKVYRGDVARGLYADCGTDGYMFDIEVLLRAQRRGHKIAEFPVRWTCDRDSRLRPERDVLHALLELWRIKGAMKRTEGKR